MNVNNLNKDAVVSNIQKSYLDKNCLVCVLQTRNDFEMAFHISKDLAERVLLDNSGNYTPLTDISERIKHCLSSKIDINQKAIFMFKNNWCIGGIKSFHKPSEYNGEVLGNIMGLVLYQNECIQALDDFINMTVSTEEAFDAMERRQLMEVYKSVPELDSLIKELNLE